MADQSNNTQTKRLAGFISILGALSMFLGAALWGATGTDLWQALADQQMANYLNQLANVKQLLVANTAFWILGVLLLGIAGALMSGFCISKPGLAQMSLGILRTAVPLAIVSFITMLSLAIYPPNVEAASTIGWIGTCLDDLATMLIIGATPFFISIAGNGNWVPRWLLIWGCFAGVAGILGIVGMLTGNIALGLVIIPVGLGWMIAAGVVLIKKK